MVARNNSFEGQNRGSGKRERIIKGKEESHSIWKKKSVRDLGEGKRREGITNRGRFRF